MGEGFSISTDLVEEEKSSSHSLISRDMVRPPLHLHRSSLTIKFLCSYGGKILPRYPDGKLRYRGGQTRLLSFHSSVSFSELLLKLGELCGTSSVSLRCQFPYEDLDALVSITSDEDLFYLIEEYDRAASPSSLKIRAFLFPSKHFKTITIPRVPMRSFQPPNAFYLQKSASAVPLSLHNFCGNSWQMWIHSGYLCE